MPATQTRLAQFDRSDQHRRSMLAKVHIAKKQLQLTDDDYRQIVFEETGRTSAGDCSEAQLEKVIGRFRRQGFRPVPAKRKTRTATHPVALKARAMWISLHQLGVVQNPSDQALEAFAKRQLGCDRLVWARQSHGYRLIEALKAMAERAGWRQREGDGGALSPLRLREALCMAILAKLKAAGVADDRWTLETAAFRLTGAEPRQREGAALIEYYTRLADALGKVLREHAPSGETV
ncbi:MAG: regulatory protein GemA [Alteraurantiacibacter sp.]